MKPSDYRAGGARIEINFAIGACSLGSILVARSARGVCAILLGVAYGMCLMSGLRQVERLAAAEERGAVAACFYVLAYLGFAAPYLAAGLGAVTGRTGALAILAIAALALAAWTAGYAAWSAIRSSTPIEHATEP
jgi:hypothetical protein